MAYASVDIECAHGVLSDDCAVIHLAAAFLGNDHEFESESFAG